MSEILIRKNENSIAILSLNDLPANSLSMPMMIRIQKELSDIDKDSSIRVVIIKSESEKIFCSGHNLSLIHI